MNRTDNLHGFPNILRYGKKLKFFLQINITGFLNARQAREFMSELWALLVEANEAEDGIPKSLVEKKLETMKLNQSSRYEKIGVKLNL